MCALPIVAMYRRIVAGFLPALTSCSMNARIVAGSAGRYDSPRSSQNAWKIAPSAFCALSVFAQLQAKFVLTIHQPITHSSFIFKHATEPQRAQCHVVERA
jgi:hypothetical protein